MSDQDLGEELGRRVAQNLGAAILRALGDDNEEYESARSSSPEQVQDEDSETTVVVADRQGR